MRALRDRSTETVHLSALRERDAVFLSAAESGRLVRVSSRVGQHPAAHTTAAGKVLLAELDGERLGELYPEEPLPGATPSSITGRTALFEELGRVRSRGHARNTGESETDMYAIAVPVRRPGGGAVCSLSIAAPLTRVPHGRTGPLSSTEQGYLAALRAAAAEIEDLLVF
jgi:DNA-binding IclR family transcriptional regulator